MSVLEFISNNELYGQEEHRIRKLFRGAKKLLTFEAAKKGCQDEYHCELAYYNLISSGEINFGFADFSPAHDTNSPVFIIVGGGVCGMISSLQIRNLHHAYGLPDPYVVICEADSALGGRVKGQKVPFRSDASGQYKPDYGCQFLYDIQDPRIQQLCSQLDWTPELVPPIWECTVYDITGKVVEPSDVEMAVSVTMNILNAIDKSKSNTNLVSVEFRDKLPEFIETPSKLECQLFSLVVAELEYRFGSFDSIYPCHLPDEVILATFHKYAVPQHLSSFVQKFDSVLRKVRKQDDDESVETLLLPKGALEFHNPKDLPTSKLLVSDLILKNYESGIYCCNNFVVDTVSPSKAKTGNDEINIDLAGRVELDTKEIKTVASAAIVCSTPYKWEKMLLLDKAAKNRADLPKEITNRCYGTCLESASICCDKFKSNGYFYVLSEASEDILHPQRGLFYFFKHISANCSILTTFCVGLGAESFLGMKPSEKYKKLLKKVEFLKIDAHDMISSNFGNNSFISAGFYKTDPQLANSIKKGFGKSIYLQLASDCLEDGTFNGALKSANLAANLLFSKYYKSLFDFEEKKRDYESGSEMDVDE